MTLLKNCLVPWDQTILHFRRTSIKRTKTSIAVALVTKINNSNNVVLITYSEVRSNFVSLMKYLSATSAKSVLILSYFVLSYSTEYLLIFFTCESNSIFPWLQCHPHRYSVTPTAVFPNVEYKAEVEVNVNQCKC